MCQKIFYVLTTDANMLLVCLSPGLEAPLLMFKQLAIQLTEEERFSSKLGNSR